MFNKKLLIATLIVTVIAFLLSFVWYDLLMGDFFPATEGVDRDPVSFPLIIVGMLIFSYAFCRIYQMIYDSEEKLMNQAVRYGLLTSLLVVVSSAIVQHATTVNWGLNHILVDAIFNIVLLVVLAIAAAYYFGPGGSRGGGGGTKGGGPT